MLSIRSRVLEAGMAGREANLLELAEFADQEWSRLSRTLKTMSNEGSWN